MNKTVVLMQLFKMAWLSVVSPTERKCIRDVQFYLQRKYGFRWYISAPAVAY